MAKIDIKSEELVLNNDEIKGKLRNKLNSIVSDVYKLIKEYKKSYSKSSSIDANLEITINEDEFKINMTIDKDSKVTSKASCTNNGFTLVQNIELNDESTVPTTTKKDDTKDSEKKYPSKSHFAPIKSDKDFEDKNMHLLQQILAAIKMGNDDSYICKKYNVSEEVIDNIRAKFNLEKPAATTTKKYAGYGRIKDRLAQYKDQIIQDIVEGKMMIKEIAHKYQVLPCYISKFKSNHAEEIEAKKNVNETDAILEKLGKSTKEDTNAKDPIPDIDSDLEAKIIEELISQTSILDISKKYNVPSNTIINILNFNRELINRAMDSDVTVPKVDENEIVPATEDDLKALAESFQKG